MAYGQTYGPWKNTVSDEESLHSLWNKSLYIWLRNFFLNLKVDQTLAEVNAEFGGRSVPQIYKDWLNAEFKIPIDLTAAGLDYSSYFKLYDASASGDCKVGVTDGGWLATGDPPSTPTNCGVVNINGVRVDVPVFVSAAITAAGVYYVWLHMWIDPADAESAEIIVGSADDDDAPDNPNGGVSFSSRLLGRISVMEDGGAYFASGITQDYLAGGEHAEILWGDCEGDGEEE